MKNKIIQDFKQIIIDLTSMYDMLIIESVKNKKLKKILSKIDNIKIHLLDILNIIKNDNDNICLINDNNIYLSYINNRYIITKKLQNGQTQIIHKNKKLKRSLKHFYYHAYNEKIKK